MQNTTPNTTGLSPLDAAAFRAMAVIALLLGGVWLYFGIANAVDALAHGRAVVEFDLQAPQPIGVGQAEAVTVTAEGMGAGPAALIAAGSVLGGLIAITVGIAIAIFLWRLAQGRPFHRSLYATTLLAGGAMALGGLLAAFLSGFGAMQLAFELDPAGEVIVPGFTFDPSIMATGSVVVALAFAFRAGTRLQRDTEGLV